MEVSFLQGACAQLAKREMTSFLELGCGPATHAISLAKRGVKSTALDVSAKMLEFAREKANQAGVCVNFVEGDMRHFSLPERVDAVFVPLGTLSHAISNMDALSVLKTARMALALGGIIIIEAMHPADIFGGDLLMGDTWDVPGCGDAPALLVEYGTEEDEFDSGEQVVHRRVAVSEVTEAGTALLGEELVPQRVFTLQELRLLAQSALLEVAGVYGDLDIDIGLQHDDAHRLVVVLRKDCQD